jgi:hypothetical protein
MNRAKTFLSLIVVSIALAATGCGFSGAYETNNGAASVTFKSGKAKLTMLNDSEECDYEMKGNKIIVHSKRAGDIEFTKNDDGTIDGPAGNMKKRKT